MLSESATAVGAWPAPRDSLAKSEGRYTPAMGPTVWRGDGRAQIRTVPCDPPPTGVRGGDHECNRDFSTIVGGVDTIEATY
jgi:hypothetical protein